MEKVVMERSGLFIGKRFHVANLCGMHCVVDCMPDDPSYIRVTKEGNIYYLWKIILEVKSDNRKVKELNRYARKLENEWIHSELGICQMKEYENYKSEILRSTSKSPKHKKIKII